MQFMPQSEREHQQWKAILRRYRGLDIYCKTVSTLTAYNGYLCDAVKSLDADSVGS